MQLYRSILPLAGNGQPNFRTECTCNLSTGLRDPWVAWGLAAAPPGRGRPLACGARPPPAPPPAGHPPCPARLRPFPSLVPFPRPCRRRHPGHHRRLLLLLLRRRLLRHPPFAGNAAGDSTLILAFAFALPTLAASASAPPVIELSLNSIPRGPGSQRSGTGPDLKSTLLITEMPE